MGRPRTIRTMIKRIDEPILTALWGMRVHYQRVYLSEDERSLVNEEIRRAIRECISNIRVHRSQPDLKLVK